MGLTGYVRNSTDGSVEITAEGDEKILLEFEKHIKKGPAFSRVLDTNSDWNKIEKKQYKGFSITY